MKSKRFITAIAAYAENKQVLERITSTLVKENQFNWLMGKEYVATYKKKLVLLHHFVIDVVRLSLIKLMVQTICGYRWGFSNNRLNQI